MKNLETKMEVIKKHNLCKMVAELNANGNNLEGAVNWVYDSIVLNKEDFRKKYFGF